MAWDYIQPVLDEDSARYEATREKRAKAGALGGSARAKAAKQGEANEANASIAKQSEANLANQANSIQFSSDHFNSITGDRADKPRTHPRFLPPSVEEVAAYCREKGYAVDAERFVDFYASKGWMVGKNPMRDWTAAVRTWERSEGRGRNGSGNRGNYTPPDDDLINFF